MESKTTWLTSTHIFCYILVSLHCFFYYFKTWKSYVGPREVAPLFRSQEPCVFDFADDKVGPNLSCHDRDQPVVDEDPFAGNQNLSKT